MDSKSNILPASPSSDSSSVPSHSRGREHVHSHCLSCLPSEIKESIVCQLGICDLASLARVSRSFHELAASVLYRKISHTFYPGSAMDDFFSWQLFTDTMKPLITSAYNYGQYVREVTISSIDGFEVLGRQIYNSRSPECFDRNGPLSNALLAQLVNKAPALANFRWGINMELDPSLLLALSHTDKLQSLHLRLSPDGPASTPSEAFPLYGTVPSSMHHLPGVSNPANHIIPTVSGLKNLAILDIPSLDCIPEVASCISSCYPTIRNIQLSFADNLALKRSRFIPANSDHPNNSNDEQIFEFADMFGSDSEDEPQDPLKDSLFLGPTVKQELVIQQDALAFLFGLGLTLPSSNEPNATKRHGSHFLHLISGLTIHDSAPSSAVGVEAAINGVESPLSSIEPASFVESGPSNARTSISSMSGTSFASTKPNVKTVKDYVRETHGLPVEELYIYQVPVTADTLTRGVDLSSLRHLSLLNVGPQDHIWEAMKQRHLCNPYNLKSIHTDHVVESFLEFVHSLPKILELFILERRHGSKLVNTPCTTVGMADIRRLVLEKHISHLERLVMRHDENTTWVLDPSTTVLITSAPNMIELAISIDYCSYPFVIRNVKNMISLKALQIFWYHEFPDNTYLRREVALFVDHILRYAELRIEYVGMCYVKSGPVTNCIVHVPSRLAQLHEMEESHGRSGRFGIASIFEGGSRISWNDTPLTTVPDEVRARSAAAGFEADEIVGVKMWEPRTWSLKL
ncbi:hypothetical protein BDV59DRAFT_207549 [Aspergillus ambiguus]|uniref:F-box protein n=1 Tax=Aspergillus ambiguus TaxID=176160 RepID=UPI003CCE2451